MVTPKTATTNPPAARKRFAPASPDDACSLYAKRHEFTDLCLLVEASGNQGRWPGAFALARALRDQGVVLQGGAPSDD